MGYALLPHLLRRAEPYCRIRAAQRHPAKTQRPAKNLQLDAGVNLGLTGEVDDVNVFTGITIRF